MGAFTLPDVVDRDDAQARLDRTGPIDEVVWIRTRDAATVLGVAVGHVNHLARTDRLVTWRMVGRQRWLLRSEVEALGERRTRWVSYVGAAAIIGRSRETVRAMVRAGRLEQRHAGTTAVASISRASAERVAAELAAAAAERATTRSRRPDEAAPDDDHEWVGPAAAGELLGVTADMVRRMAREEKVPAVRRGRRWWFRRDQLSVVANARAARGFQV